MDGSRSLLSDYFLGRHKARLFFWGGGVRFDPGENMGSP